MKEYIELFISFAKVGGLTFGGGYAMLPILQKEVVEKKNWVTYEEVMDYYAIGQCTPGIISVNTAIFIGYQQKKLLGGIAAALGVVFPSVVIILIIAAFLSNFMEHALVVKAFNGIQIAVAALVFNATLTLYKKGVKDKFTLALFAVCFVIFVFVDLSPVFVVVSSAILGIAVKTLGGKA